MFVGFVRVRSVHSRAPLVTSGSIVGVRSIAVHPGCRSGLFDPFTCSWGSSGSFGCVPSIPVLLRDCPVPSGAFTPFPFSLGVI